MMQQKYLFIDRDGTLLAEPPDEQVDSLEKLEFMPGVFAALSQLQAAGYQLVIITNQDRLGTSTFPQQNFDVVQIMMLKIFASQGIQFEAIRICPHVIDDNCECRKPKVGLLLDYLQSQSIDRTQSFVIGDRESDAQLAANLGINSITIGSAITPTWAQCVNAILTQPRRATLTRKTKETNIMVHIDLDNVKSNDISTGIDFFDHMLAQLAAHAGFGLITKVQGDLHIDDHH